VTRLSYSFVFSLLVLLVSVISVGFPSLQYQSPPIRVIFMCAGLITIFFLPGLSITFFLKNRLNDKLSLFELSCLSIGFSLIIAIIVTAFLSTYWYCSQSTVLAALGSITLLTSITSAVLQNRSSETHTIKNVNVFQMFKKIKSRMRASRLNALIFIVLLVLIIFAIVPYPIGNQSNDVLYLMAANSSSIALILLATVTSFLLYSLHLKKSHGTIAKVLLIVLVLFISLKARSYPAFVSFGLGDRVGIDSWDSLGHLTALVNSGTYSLTEPFIWIVRSGQITALPHPFPAGYFALMGSVSMLSYIDPLTLTKSVFLFGALQSLFVYLLVKKLTGDNVKGFLASLLIASGALTSDNILFTNGVLSPIASIGLSLLPFGLYLLTFSNKKLKVFLVLLTALSLFYLHIASAIIYIVLTIFLLAYPKIKKLNLKTQLSLLLIKIKYNWQWVIVSASLLFTVALPIILFWLQTYGDPNALYSIHYSERFTFSIPSAQETAYFPSFKYNTLFYILLGYGLFSYVFSKQPRKERNFLLAWNFTLLLVYLLLFYTNPQIAYRIIAYLYQSVYALAACAFIRDIFKIRTRYIKFKRLLAPCLLFLMLLTAFLPVYERQGTPDEVFFQQEREIRPYFLLANWVNSNLTANAVVVINNFTSYSEPVNILRDMGVTIVGGANLTLQNYIDIQSNFTSSYILDLPFHTPTPNVTQTTAIYTYHINNSTSISLYNLESVLEDIK
jgi:hypothetical protein